MMRLSSLFWIALAGMVGYGLFHLKHEVQALEDELAKVQRQTLAEQQAIHVLRAEWSHVNQPQRLQDLAERHLDLSPTRPGQVGQQAVPPRRPPEGAARERAAELAAAPSAPNSRATAGPQPTLVLHPAPEKRKER